MSFEIKYDLQFGNERYQRSYPAEDDKNNNIFKISGKNEQGKTTTLKIIAFAFNTIDVDAGNINEEIREEVSELEDNDTVLNFNFKVQSPDGKLTLECVYHNKIRNFKLNGKDIGEQEIQDKFIVLFDVPEPLQDKLQNPIKNIRSQFNNYINIVDDYNRHLESLYKELKHYENSVMRKEKIKTRILNLRNDLNNYQKLKIDYEKDLTSLKIKFVIYLFESFSNKFNELDNRYEKIKTLIKKSGNKDKKESNDYSKLFNEIQNLVEMSDSMKEGFRRNLEKEQLTRFTQILKEIDDLLNINELNNEIISHIYQFYIYIRDIANKSQNVDASDRSYRLRQEFDLVNKLLNLISEYENINPEIPGAGKRMNEFIKPLEDRRHELSILIGKKENVELIIENCNKIISQLGKVGEQFKNYTNHKNNGIQKDNNIDIEGLDKEKSEISEEMNRISKELTTIEDEYNSIPEEDKKKFNPDPYIEADYKKKKFDIAYIENKIIATNNNISILEGNLNSYEEAPQPNTNLSLEEIDNKTDLIQKINSKLFNYNRNLQNVDFKKMKYKNTIDNQESDFYNKIGKYLGQVVGKIHHNKKIYKIDKIDFATGEYILAGGEETIKFTRIGRGTTELNALLAKIQQNFNGKTKIVLIDEIGDMDLDNQQTLLGELKKQIISGETLLGMLTERNDNNKDVKFVPVHLEV